MLSVKATAVRIPLRLTHSFLEVLTVAVEAVYEAGGN
jgi:hypothetical protein